LKAMILAAGFGARMRPLSFDRPKALIPIAGIPLLQILLRKLKNAGFDDIAVNSHYKADILHEFIQKYETQTNFTLHFSQEQEILNTGGGIKKMLAYFHGDDPILVHNVDILSAVNLSKVIAYHLNKRADCTMVVNKSDSDRSLCFDQSMNFKGRYSEETSANNIKYNFCGIQVIQPSIFREISAKSFYSIDAYISASKHGQKIIAYDIGKAYWRDIGRAKDIEAANQDIKDGKLVIEG